MLVVAVVFLIIGGVSTAVQLAASLSDNYPDDDDDDDDYNTIMSSAVSISLSKLDSSPLFGIITPKRRESGSVRLCIIIYNGFMHCFSDLCFSWCLYDNDCNNPFCC